ncbi:MAG: aldo/keto reductase [Ardenticatenaceae bacterium]|nr:aldo/keto reductase [Ardenticatenaceae bacterium]
MDYRTLGHNEVTVSTLSLGTVALGMAYGIAPADQQVAGEQATGLRPPTLPEATALIHRALDGGITHIDTARGYGNSEAVVGHALQGKRQQVILTTKGSCFGPDGLLLRGKALQDQLESSLTESLRLLETDYVDVFMLHSAPEAVFADEEVVGFLRDLKRRGLTRLIGASTYGTAAPIKAIEQGVEVLQIAYNVLDQTMADAVLPRARDRGVGLVIRSVYLKGALTPRIEDLPERLAPLKERVHALAAYGAAISPPLSLVEIALRFVLSQPLISTALVGVRTAAELDLALAQAGQPVLPPDVMDKLEAFGWHHELLNPGNWGLP